jgi:hypothetical protein
MNKIAKQRYKMAMKLKELIEENEHHSLSID